MRGDLSGSRGSIGKHLVTDFNDHIFISILNSLYLTDLGGADKIFVGLNFTKKAELRDLGNLVQSSNQVLSMTSSFTEIDKVIAKK